MTDPIAKGVKLEDAIVILREGLRSDRPLTLKERLLIGKIIDERAALTAAGEMERELAEAREALKPIAELFADAQGRLTPDYGEVTGRDFQMITMHPDPEGLAADLRRAAHAYANKDIQ